MGKIRQTDSKRKIERAFVRLLATKKYSQISISSLAKAAQVNRGTFYLNYLDKDDLLHSVEKDFFNGLVKILNSDTKTATGYFSNEAIIEIALYLKKNYYLVHAFLESDLSTSMNQQFMQILKQSFAAKHANLTSPAIPAPYAIEVIFSSTISIFSLWIKREMRESIPELLEIVRKYSELSRKEIITI